ncbi:DUF6431 domain-containing protein [Acetivibrio cellulolyticus]|uniref:DUF6431 domain-containing protein n=1 Tax=Acetivibrio cellulolyticus TaxID=35830 RepID=UPI0001E2C6A5|nr:DUF6431 domain-containing protein [Acetivibrio cellulolyticus]
MSGFIISEFKCPCCKTKHPDWKKHSQYNRYLVSFENGCVVYYQITVTRYQCSSCGHTHAILPESIIPYCSYSFLFILAVMRDYFNRSITVTDICAKYNISVSTLYSWKSLFLNQKKIWIGLLEDACTSSIQFLNSENLLYKLEEFFLIAGVSFLQNAHIKKAKYNPP